MLVCLEILLLFLSLLLHLSVIFFVDIMPPSYMLIVFTRSMKAKTGTMTSSKVPRPSNKVYSLTYTLGLFSSNPIHKVTETLWYAWCSCIEASMARTGSLK